MSNMMEIDSPLSSPTTEMEAMTPTAATATASATTATTTTTQIKIHPLAIIGISDHQTRITTGGSPLSISSSSSTTESGTGSDTQNQTQSPIIGLLFGYQNGTTISIIDAEEIEYPSSYNQISNEQRNTIKTKIELHQKVFPKHEVVGWYRVDISGGAGGGKVNGNVNVNDNGTEEEEEEVLPTETDLIINNGMKEYSKSDNPLLFVLMDANEKNDEDNNSSSNSNSSRSNTNSNADSDSNSNEKDPKKKKNNTMNEIQGEDARDKLDRDEQLPLTIYEPMVTTTSGDGNGNGAVFVNLDFELETFEPERIAVEKVFKTQPKNTGGNIAVSTTTKSDSKLPANPEDATAISVAAATTTATATTTDKTTTSTQVQTQSASGTQIQSLITSIDAMNTRIAVLLDFLQRTQNGDIPPDHTLLRQVGSLVNQLPLVMGRGVFSSRCSSDDDDNDNDKEETKMKNDILVKEFENEYDDMLVLSFLATIAKTTKAVLSYSEKFKVINEARSSRGEMAKGR